MRIVFGLIIAAAFLITSSCKKKVESIQNVKIEFEHEFDNMSFRADTSTLYNFSDGIQGSFSSLRYYFSNIRLKSETGEWWSDENSYYIIDATELKPTISLSVPAGKYIEMAYTIGVDSVKNFSGAQAGALSPSNGMFWSWQTGYIFMIVEGQCPQIDRNNKFFIHHLGGFTDPNNAIRSSSNTLPVALNVSDSPNQAIVMGVNVRNLYDREDNRIRLNEVTGIHHPGPNAMKVANNFTSMFRVKDVRN
jgi:hypothetical protein